MDIFCFWAAFRRQEQADMRRDLCGADELQVIVGLVSEREPCEMLQCCSRGTASHPWVVPLLKTQDRPAPQSAPVSFSWISHVLTTPIAQISYD